MLRAVPAPCDLSLDRLLGRTGDRADLLDAADITRFGDLLYARRSRPRLRRWENILNSFPSLSSTGGLDPPGLSVQGANYRGSGGSGPFLNPLEAPPNLGGRP